MSSLTVQDAQFIYHISELYDKTKENPNANSLNIDDLDQESTQCLIEESKDFTNNKPNLFGVSYSNLGDFPGPILAPLFRHFNTLNWIDKSRLLHPDLQSGELKKTIETIAKEKLGNKYQQNTTSAKKQYLRHIFFQALRSASTEEKNRIFNLMQRRSISLSFCENMLIKIENVVVPVLRNPLFQLSVSFIPIYFSGFILGSFSRHIISKANFHPMKYIPKNLLNIATVALPIVKSLARIYYISCFLSIFFLLYAKNRNSNLLPLAEKNFEVIYRPIRLFNKSVSIRIGRFIMESWIYNQIKSSVTNRAHSIAQSAENHQREYYRRETIKAYKMWKQLLHADA